MGLSLLPMPREAKGQGVSLAPGMRRLREAPWRPPAGPVGLGRMEPPSPQPVSRLWDRPSQGQTQSLEGTVNWDEGGWQGTLGGCACAPAPSPLLQEETAVSSLSRG